MGAAEPQQETAIVAFDGSPAARRAVAEAGKVLSSCRILVVTVWEEGLAYAVSAGAPDPIIMTPPVEPDVALEVDREVHDEAERVSREGTELAKSHGLDAQPLAMPAEPVAPVMLGCRLPGHRRQVMLAGRHPSHRRHQVTTSPRRTRSDPTRSDPTT